MLKSRSRIIYTILPLLSCDKLASENIGTDCAPFPDPRYPQERRWWTLLVAVVATQTTLMAEIAKAGATSLASELSCSLKMNFKRSYREHVCMAEPAVKTSEVPQREWQTP